MFLGTAIGFFGSLVIVVACYRANYATCRSNKRRELC